MSLDVLVGVDVGSTDTKALVLGTDGRELGYARGPTTWFPRKNGEVETTGEALLSGVTKVLADALDEVGSKTGQAVRALGVGFTGMAESGMLLGPRGDVLAPVIAWFDPRGEVELLALPADVRQAFPARIGLPLTPQPTIAKLLWLRGQGVELPAGACWLNVPEYLAHVLGGERVTEGSLASRTGLLDQATGSPWSEALAQIGAQPDLIPPMLDAGMPAGRITMPGLHEGLAGALVTVAGHDHPVASIGAGATGADQLFDSCGTAEVILRTVSVAPTDAQRSALVAADISQGRHVLPSRWAVNAGTRTGLVLSRTLALLGASKGPPREALDQGWRPAPAGFQHPVVVTSVHQTGEVTLRFGDGASPEAVWAAALDHVIEAVSAVVRVIDGVVGAHRDAVAAGGWTRMPSFRDAKTIAMPGLRFSPIEQTGAYGAGLCAAWAAAGNPPTFLDFLAHFRPEDLSAGSSVEEARV